MSNNEIWVVVATDASGARILANTDGTSRVLQALAMPAHAAVGKGNVVELLQPRRPAAILARQIMAHLVDGAILGNYEGLVIVASSGMTRELRLAMDRRVFDLVLGENIENTPVATSPIAALRSA